MFSRGSKITAGALLVPTVICTLLAGLNLYHEIWAQWSEWGWANMWAGAVHSELFLVLAGIAVVNFAILFVVGAWWLMNARKPTFPHRGFAAWFALLLIGAASYFPSDQQYAAIAVLLFGPGQKSQEFQSYAAMRDSTMLLNALVVRGIQVDSDVLCVAARYDSTRVINRLVERGLPVNVECDRSKATALHTAVEAKQHRSAKILVEAGAKADLADVRGDTPLDLALTQGDERMVRILAR